MNLCGFFFHAGCNSRHVHGGAIATMIDTVTGTHASAISAPVMTANLNIDYRRYETMWYNLSLGFFSYESYVFRSSTFLYEKQKFKVIGALKKISLFMYLLQLLFPLIYRLYNFLSWSAFSILTWNILVHIVIPQLPDDSCFQCFWSWLHYYGSPRPNKQFFLFQAPSHWEAQCWLSPRWRKQKAENYIFHAKWPALMAQRGTLMQQVNAFPQISTQQPCLLRAAFNVTLLFSFMQHCLCRSVSLICWKGDNISVCHKQQICHRCVCVCVWHCKKKTSVLLVWNMYIFSIKWKLNVNITLFAFNYMLFY